TKSRGGMLPRAEAQTRIQHDHGLVFARTPLAPAGLDQEGGADFHRLEMTFPGFGPVFAAQFADGDLARGNLQSAFPDAGQGRREFAAGTLEGFWFSGDVNRNRGFAGLDIRVGRRRGAEVFLEQFRHGVFRFGGGEYGNRPERRRFHEVRRSRHGVKLSSSISTRCECSATCETLAYSTSNKP